MWTLDDEITPDDLRARQIERDSAGPHCPTNILAALMASAKLSLVQEAISRLEAQRNERLKHVRLKARRARELREAFA